MHTPKQNTHKLLYCLSWWHPLSLVWSTCRWVSAVLCSGVRHISMLCKFLFKFIPPDTLVKKCFPIVEEKRERERFLKTRKIIAVIYLRAKQPGALSVAPHWLPGQDSKGLCRLPGQILDAFEKLVIDQKTQPLRKVGSQLSSSSGQIGPHQGNLIIFSCSIKWIYFF